MVVGFYSIMGWCYSGWWMWDLAWGVMGWGRKGYLRPTEIASFSSRNLSRRNKHDSFWLVLSTGYFYILFLWTIVVSDFLPLEIHVKVFYIQVWFKLEYCSKAWSKEKTLHRKKKFFPVDYEHVYMRPEVNSSQFEIWLRGKISLRCKVISLSAFTWLRA